VALAYGTKDLDFGFLTNSTLEKSEICAAWMKECKPELVGIVISKKSSVHYKIGLIVVAVVVGAVVLGCGYWYSKKHSY